eukprot:7341193-Pyramimonas_sp.AAC.1
MPREKEADLVFTKQKTDGRGRKKKANYFALSNSHRNLKRLFLTARGRLIGRQLPFWIPKTAQSCSM